MPVPFRVDVVDPDGRPHVVDAIATGRTYSPEEWYWIVVLVPAALTGSVSQTFDLAVAGADRVVVKRKLCEELAVDNASYLTRWMLVELPPGGPLEITHANDDDDELARAIGDDLRRGWTPWQGMGQGDVGLVLPDDLPADTGRVLERLGWRRAIVAPVFVNQRLAGAIFMLGRVPESYPLKVIKRNIAVRVEKIVRAAALLLERWEDQDRLLSAATSDALTGLGNNRALDDELATATHHGSLLYVDVDHFKQVNDTYGHPIGDRVLQIVAGRIVASCRNDDVVIRSGGDEFVVVLHGADLELARRIGQRIIEAMEEPLPDEDGPSTISVSIGLAPLREADPIGAADQAMMLAKRGGRGRLVVVGD